MTAGPEAADPWTLALLPQFLDLTASRQNEIDIERGNLEAGEDPLSAAREIGKIAHKIAGTAASFGFGGLGRQSQRIELICNQICSLSDATRDEAVKTYLLPALDDLSGEMTKALMSAP
ncbi:Hpt domain-containing protein [Pseudotabrizicola sp. 4114]|uniref:Hpt domain-containing protein n=1 Tax=Pseudotabrizicola sp. 4114 TaxID=2817731 RepID=UPI00285B9E7C|nr:HPt (histidine-containing phosphotransfer) domain-containing protein [Pseudorhodobacter sp. 4114]